MSIGTEIKNWYKMGSVVNRLIMINVGIFLVFSLLAILSKFTHTNLVFVEPWLYASSDFTTLLYKPWSIVTYMFLHSGFRHILFNMLFLFFFGRVTLTFLSQRQFLAIYLLGGIAGYFLYAASFNIFPYFQNQIGLPIVGASAAIMAVMAATVTIAPNYEVRLLLIPFNIKLIWIGLLFFVQDIFALQGDVNIGGSLAHIGGAVFGYIAIIQLKKGNSLTAWLEKLIANIENVFKPKLKVKYKSTNTSQKPKSDDQYNLEKKERQAKVDSILDKIKQSGYESLSKAEKDFLFNEGKNL